MPMFGMNERQLEMMMRVARILTQKYDVVCTNPPYMGGSGMNTTLSTYVKKNFPDSKSDLFACFMEKCGQLIKRNGLYAMITQHAWMFLSSYEKLREKLKMHSIVDMAHLGARAFDEIGGEVVQTTAFVSCGRRVADFKGTYVRLVDIIGEWEKEAAYRSGNHRYTAKQENFSKIPGSPVAYWVSENFVRTFSERKLDIYKMNSGVTTGKDDDFIKEWYEIPNVEISFESNSYDEFNMSKKKYATLSKGGYKRRWYGNNELVIWYDFKGKENMSKISSHAFSGEEDYFKTGITWGEITSGNFSARFHTHNIHSHKSPTIFTEKDLSYVLGYLNTNIFNYYVKLINPTISTGVNVVKKIPIIVEEKIKPEVNQFVQENIALSKADWDSFETSWDFEGHPLV